MRHKPDTEEEFKADVLQFVELMQVNKPRRTLWDMRALEFVVSPALESWIDLNINAKEVECGIEREAFLIAESYVAEIGVEETMGNEYGEQLNTAYFRVREEAIDWLTQ